MSSTWQSSGRRDRLPSNWQKLRKLVLKNSEGLCQAWLEDGSRCRATATDVDHIKHGDDHSLSNLQALCAPHHAKKSAREGHAAMAAKRRKMQSRFQRVEEHPGMI